MENVINEVI